MKVYVGNIVTVNKQNDVVSYLVEDKGRIVYVGNELPEKYSSVAKKMLGNWEGQNMCRTSFLSCGEDPANSQCQKSRLLKMMASLLYLKAKR